LSAHPSVGLADAVSEQNHAGLIFYIKPALQQGRRRKKNSARRLLPLSIVAYLGYSYFCACGSPFDNTTDKPAICQAIDPIKLDIYAAYQSDFYKTNLDPYIAPVVVRANKLYHVYGIPAQTKLVNLYQQHGKPVVDYGCLQATPYLNNVKGNLRNTKGNYYFVKAKLAPYCDEATAKVNKVQAFIQYQYEQLPPPVIQAKDKAQATVLYWIDRAENTDLVPVLTKYYEMLVELYHYYFVPLSDHVTHHAKQQYDAHLKLYVDEHVKPLLIKCNDRVHLDQLLGRARALLNQRELSHSVTRDETVATTIGEIKTPTTTPKTVKDIPITTTGTVVSPVHKETHVNIVDKAEEIASAIKDKVKEGILFDIVKEATDKVKEAADKVKEAAFVNVLVEKANDAAFIAAATSNKVEETATESSIVDDAEDAAHFATHIIKDDKDVPAEAKEAVSEAYDSVIEKETPTLASTTITASAEATLGHPVSNTNEDIVHKPATASVAPLTTPDVFEDVPIPPPDANKKEAIYCPTCNAQDEQLIIAPTDKHVAAVHKEPKEVFEVHKQQVIATPPQSPNNADYLKKDVQAIADEKELFEVHKEPIITAPESSIVKEEEIKTNDQYTEEQQVGKKNIKIPIPTTDTLEDDVVPNDESQFDHDEYKDAHVLQDAFTAVEKGEPSVVAEKNEQPTVVVVTEEEEPVVPDDQSEFVVVEKEDIAVGGIPAEESEEVPKKVEDITSV
jgi:hypothetical protein